MKFFLKLFLVFLVFINGISLGYTENNINGDKDSLTILIVQPVSSQQIDVTFSDAVTLDTLRVTVENQVTRQNIKVKDYEETKKPETIAIILNADLQPGTTYKLVVNSILSIKNQTINTGIDSIREFVTPSKFSEGKTALISNDGVGNNNKTTTISSQSKTSENYISGTQSGTNIEKNTTQSISSPENGNSNSQNRRSKKDAKKLPEAGVDILLFLIPSFIIMAIFFLGRKKKHS